MNHLTIFFFVTTIIGFSAFGFCIYLLRKMDLTKIRMENYLVTIGQVTSNFYARIESLFNQSIHYYDETIFQFVESTKEVKKEIDTVLNEYEDLKEFIVPVPTPEERQQQQQAEILGVVKSYPVRRV